MALPRSTRITEKEYLALEEASDIRHEFVDGYVIAMTGASKEHARIITTLTSMLYSTLRKRNCEVLSLEVRIRFSKIQEYFYPDISVTCGEAKFADDTKAATLLNPTVILEVLSPSTELYDRTTKFKNYQQIASLRDYVLVAQESPQIECFSRGEGESWILTQAAGLESSLLIPAIDVTLSLAEVYEQITFDGDDHTGRP